MAISTAKPIVNPDIVYREELDDWALLFDPGSGDAFVLNPVAAIIWKKLDGSRSFENIISELKSDCEKVPATVKDEVMTFLDELVKHGFIAA